MNQTDRDRTALELAVSRDLMIASLTGGLAASSLATILYAIFAPGILWWGVPVIALAGPFCAFLGAGITISNRLMVVVAVWT